jgi:aspartyl-tRNA(Asn)/glutamyl-tRNA(Gln) amidotransferase subunit A
VSAADIVSDVSARRRSAVEVTREALDHLDAIEPGLHAFLSVFREQAPRAAARVDARLAAGERLPLAGVPVAIKDNLCTGPDLHAPGDGLGYGGFTTAGSRMLEHYRSPFTATAVQRLIDAGAVILGKTNLDEFAMGSSTEHSAFGPTRNPWDPTRVPGGSSGGSAAAVAAGVCPIALGSDTGGSIRQPASHCGVVGIKPTYGRVSRLGLIAFASSLDQVGPFGSCVADAALALEVICGYDAADSTSAPRPVPPWTHEVNTPLPNLVVGVPRVAQEGRDHPAVRESFARALAALREAGASIVDVDLPLTDHGIAAYYIVAPAEASSNLARYDGVRYGRRATGTGTLEDLYRRSRGEGFGPEVKRRIMLGTHVLSSGYYDAYYTTALKVRRRTLNDYSAAFSRCHVIATPSSPGPAFRLGEKTGDPMAMYLEDVYTVGVNLAGLPGLTLPMGVAHHDGAHLPLGIQLIAPAFEESVMLRAARMLEEALGPGARPARAART